MTLDTTELRRLHGAATAGEWQVQDGCSWRRIGTRRFDGGVLRPTNDVSDGHPDLAANDGFRDANLRAIVALHNAAPALLDAADRLARIEAVMAGDEAVGTIATAVASQIDTVEMVLTDPVTLKLIRSKRLATTALAALRELIGGV